jgi:hypothetical protein
LLKLSLKFDCINKPYFYLNFIICGEKVNKWKKGNVYLVLDDFFVNLRPCTKVCVCTVTTKTTTHTWFCKEREGRLANILDD